MFLKLLPGCPGAARSSLGPAGVAPGGGQEWPEGGRGTPEGGRGMAGARPGDRRRFRGGVDSKM